ncbi:MAG: hypothetical protein C4334_11875 [Pyrinomonas sp.]
MKSRNRSVTTFGSRAAILLLVLTVYAFLANATHYHWSRNAVSRANVADERRPCPAPDQTGGAHCALCQLQRDFLHDPGCAPAVALYVPPRLKTLVASDAARLSGPRLLAPSNRAPPQV